MKMFQKSILLVPIKNYVDRKSKLYWQKRYPDNSMHIE